MKFITSLKHVYIAKLLLTILCKRRLFNSIKKIILLVLSSQKIHTDVINFKAIKASSKMIIYNALDRAT